MRNDTLKGQRPTIPKECRQQVRQQLFQQRENIDFDPKLKAACQAEIKDLCANVPHGVGQVNTKNASSLCVRHSYAFTRFVGRNSPLIHIRLELTSNPL